VPTANSHPALVAQICDKRPSSGSWNHIKQAQPKTARDRQAPRDTPYSSTKNFGAWIVNRQPRRRHASDANERIGPAVECAERVTFSETSFTGVRAPGDSRRLPPEFSACQWIRPEHTPAPRTDAAAATNDCAVRQRGARTGFFFLAWRSTRQCRGYSRSRPRYDHRGICKAKAVSAFDRLKRARHEKSRRVQVTVALSGPQVIVVTQITCGGRRMCSTPLISNRRSTPRPARRAKARTNGVKAMPQKPELCHQLDPRERR